MPRHTKQDYLDDAYEDDDDKHDGYDKKQHPTSKYAKGLKTNAKQKEEEQEDTIESFDVDPNFHRFLIGRNGSVRDELETKYDVVIDIPKKDSHERKIYVSGRRIDCRDVIDEMNSIIAKEKVKTAVSSETSHFPAMPGQEIVTISVDFEKSAIGLFIGQGGSRVRDLKHRLTSRGENLPIANKETGVEVLTPDRGDTSSIITIKVPKHAEQKAESIIREFCSFYELLPHLRSISGAGSVESVLKGDDRAGRGGEKAKRTRNAPPQQQQQRQQQEAAPSAASTATPATATTKTNNNNNVKAAAAKSSSTAVAAVDQETGGGGNNNNNTRPERKFPEFSEKKEYKHEVLECRF